MQQLEVSAKSDHSPQRSKNAWLFDHLVGQSEQLYGILRPNAFFVVRLVTSSNLVGCTTGGKDQ
jgi:hypothetical protein